MNITSPSFSNGQGIPSLYTCDGPNVSPPIKIDNIPENAKSLALIMDDPDASSGVFTHWLLWNIDPKTNFIPESTTPDDADRGTNSMGNLTYDGPCPPSGVHHYRFKIFALDNKLGLEAGSTVDQLESVLKDHIIDQAEFVGIYSSSEI